MEFGEQCEHGGLKRHCQICELKTENEELHEQLRVFKEVGLALAMSVLQSREYLKFKPEVDAWLALGPRLKRR